MHAAVPDGRCACQVEGLDVSFFVCLFFFIFFVFLRSCPYLGNGLFFFLIIPGPRLRVCMYVRTAGH